MLLIFASIVCAWCRIDGRAGIKIDRALLFVKMFKARLRRQQHPNAVIRLKVDGVIQESDHLNAVSIFIVTYLVLIFFGALINAFCGLDLVTSITAPIACIGNVGPGFGDVGTMDNYSALPAFVRLQSTLLMLLGRLEIFGFIQLFFIKWWR